MVLQPFTDNFADNSTEAGFQFTFYCDFCREGYKTKFVESKTYKKAGLFRNLSKGINIISHMIGQGNVGSQIERGTNVLSERFHGMSPEWQREHEVAFEQAQNEAKDHFHRCPHCTKWLCENDWNEQDGLCVECAPRESVEVAKARAQKRAKDIEDKAAETNVFKGKIEAKQTLCPQCGKPSGESKFCINCGTSLVLPTCPKCGAQSPAGTRFCGECGAKL